jgi:hypothetical protein
MDGFQGFQVPETITPNELGDTLARLVWESFSDFMAEDDAEVSLTDLGVETKDGLPPGHLAEEALIFLMWAHTRGAQLAFVGRAEEQLIKGGLDSLHDAIFHDMVHQGTPPGQILLFEQRVGARYAEYNQAAARSDSDLSRSALRHLTGEASESPTKAMAILDRALAVASPLKDFLEEVQLVEA